MKPLQGLLALVSPIFEFPVLLTCERVHQVFERERERGKSAVEVWRESVLWGECV